MPCLHVANVKFLCSVHNIAIAAVVSLSGGSVRRKWPLRMPLYRCKRNSKKCDICSISMDTHFHKRASLTISYGINVSGGNLGVINYSYLYLWHTCKNNVLLHCLHKGRFPLPVPSQSWEIMGNKKQTNKFYNVITDENYHFAFTPVKPSYAPAFDIEPSSL